MDHFRLVKTGEKNHLENTTFWITFRLVKNGTQNHVEHHFFGTLSTILQGFKINFSLFHDLCCWALGRLIELPESFMFTYLSFVQKISEMKKKENFGISPHPPLGVQALLFTSLGFICYHNNTARKVPIPLTYMWITNQI